MAELKQQQDTFLEAVVGANTYKLLCSGESPLGELHDAIQQFKGYCIDRMVEAHKAELEQIEAQKAKDAEAQLEEPAPHQENLPEAPVEAPTEVQPE